MYELIVDSKAVVVSFHCCFSLATILELLTCEQKQEPEDIRVLTESDIVEVNFDSFSLYNVRECTRDGEFGDNAWHVRNFEKRYKPSYWYPLGILQTTSVVLKGRERLATEDNLAKVILLFE